MSQRTGPLTALALLAFAGNSLLCRQALGAGLMDPAGFTAARLASGALVLWMIVRFRGNRGIGEGRWASALALFTYAAAFSLAYLGLTAGTGALLLFGSVQATMLGWGLVTGERPRPAEWLGLLAALGGLFVLVRPGLAAPPAGGAALMALAGIAWGVYSLRGRGTRDPLGATAGNFLLTVPMAGALLLVGRGQLHATAEGVLLATASGALASGGGYVAWYAALPALTATRAALVQLLVPILAAAGGVMLLAESVPLRLPVAAALVLGGVALAVTARRR